MTIFGFRHSSAATLKVERYRNGKGSIYCVWFYEPEDVTGGPVTRRYERSELTEDEQMDLMDKADQEWLSYWSVDLDQLTDWAKAGIEERAKLYPKP
jgi:hypothetical protein